MYGEKNPAWKGGISKDPMYRRSGIVHDFKGKNNPRYNYKYTKVEKISMSRAQPSRKSIMFLDVKYDSIKQCIKSVGRSYDYIKRRLNKPEFKNCYYL